MVRVCVEGNIGSGKSTALEVLARRRPDLTVVQEPVEEWEPLLAKFYEDRPRWSLALSLKVLLSSSRVPGEGCVVVERSPLSCRHVFSQLLFNEGSLTQEEWELFKEYCDVLGWLPDLVVYVHTPAEECFARTYVRARKAEEHIEPEYVRRVDFQYETMLRYAEVPVVRVNGLEPPETVAAQIEEAVEAVMRRQRSAAS